MTISKIKFYFLFFLYLIPFGCNVNQTIAHEKQRNSFESDFDDISFFFPNELSELVISSEIKNPLFDGTRQHKNLNETQISTLISKGKRLLRNLATGQVLTDQDDIFTPEKRSIFENYEDYDDHYKVPLYGYKDLNTPPPPSAIPTNPSNEGAWRISSLNPFPSLNPLNYISLDYTLLTQFLHQSTPKIEPNPEITDPEMESPKSLELSGESSTENSEETKISQSERRRDYLESVVSLLWALYSLAEETGHSFEQGAFLLEDINRNVYSYLARYAHEASKTPPNCPLPSVLWCNFAYDRMNLSTHFIGRRLTHFGIDIRAEGKGLTLGILPYGMRHILVGTVQTFTGKILTFIKAETYGLGDNRELIGHTLHLVKGQMESVWPKFKILKRENTGESIKNAEDNVRFKRREKDIPFLISKEFVHLLMILEESTLSLHQLLREESQKDLKQRLLGLIKQTTDLHLDINPAQKESFINQFQKTNAIDISFMNDLVASIQELESASPLLKTQTDTLWKALTSFYEEESLFLRTGNEVLFLDDDLV